jgi:hypothetical protein
MAAIVTVPLPKWITSNKEPLGTIKENEYYEYQLDAYSPAGSGIIYTIIAGKLPPGVQLHRSGLVHGIPVIVNAVEEFDSYSFEFSVRATDRNNKVVDKTFVLNVNSIIPPEIIPTTVDLGSYFVGSYFSKQLTVLDPSPLQNFRWAIVNGLLPNGITLDQTGLISGHLMPRDTSSDVAYTTENHRGSFDGLNFDSTPFAPPVQGVDPENAFAQYTFDVEVFDGNAVDKQRYQIIVYSKNILTVDNTSILINEYSATGGSYTADLSNESTPILLTRSQELPQTRQNSNFAFKFDAIDLDGDEIRYGIYTSGQNYYDQGPTLDQPYINLVGFGDGQFDEEGQELPPGIEIDPLTGWLTGHLGSQIEDERVYVFNIFVFKANDPGSFSSPVTFTLRVLGDLNNVIYWETPDYLGEMYNGDFSHFQIKATTPSGKILVYQFEDNVDNTIGSYNRLPQGLKLQQSGLITGRASFRYFSLDKETTTFDKKKLTFDNEYVFSVRVSDTAETISSVKTFKIVLNNRNTGPYENLWLRAFPDRDVRKHFADVIDDTNYFPDELIYRSDDANFGKAKDIKFLFLPGLQPAVASKYIDNMEKHHYRKKIELGNIKTAVALDKNFDVKYEVVYVEVSDSVVYGNKTPVNEVVNIDYSTTNPYYDEYLQIYRMFYPNDYYHMMQEVVTGLGFSNRGALPEWMTSPQDDGRVLGFTRAVVLAYTVPGASKLIAYRLTSSGMQFNNVNFQLDRYQLDNYLSQNYDSVTQEFVDSEETTFDRLEPSTSTFTYVSNVDYALTVPFSEINGRSKEYINRNGGLDRTFNYKSGELLIFAKQERYETQTINQQLLELAYYDENNFDQDRFGDAIVPFVANEGYENDGWNVNAGLFAGINSFDSRPLDNVSAIPGSLENQMDSNVVNQRMGVWKIVIVDEIVFLEFVMPVLPYEYVVVSAGNAYRDTKMYHDIIIKPGNSVPEFSLLTDNISVSTDTTRFDQGSTKFINNRDQYTEPGINDKYICFPKTGVFH